MYQAEQINYKDTSGLTDLYLGSQHVRDLQINYKHTQGLTDQYLGSSTDQDSSDTSELTDLYLRSQHVPGVTDQLQRYIRVNRPVSRTTVCPRSPDGQEQPEDQYRPMTPGEEEIMRIHEDGIFYSPDMIEKSRGFWITSSSMKPGRASK